MNPVIELGTEIAASWPKMEDFEQALSHLKEECLAHGVMQVERKHLVGILLIGYLRWGKIRRQHATHES